MTELFTDGKTPEEAGRDDAREAMRVAALAMKDALSEHGKSDIYGPSPAMQKRLQEAINTLEKHPGELRPRMRPIKPELQEYLGLAIARMKGIHASECDLHDGGQKCDCLYGQVREALEQAAENLDAGDREINRLNKVYQMAVKGRADFRDALVKEREKSVSLLKVIANFANPDYWIDEPGRLQWTGKRHAIEYAQSTINENQ